MELKFDLSDFVDVLTIQSACVQLVNRMRHRRKQMKMSQRKLAVRTGVSYASIRRFETTGDISLSSLLKIANALDCLEEFTSLFPPVPVKNLKDYKV